MLRHSIRPAPGSRPGAYQVRRLLEKGAMLCMAGRGAGQPRLSLRKQGSVEESPGSTKRGWRVTPAGFWLRLGLRESATESRPPMESLGFGPPTPGKGERVRQERTARPATEAARQTPPGARPNRGGASSRRRGQAGFAPDRPGWPLEPCREARLRGMAAYPPSGGGQNPAYRLPGIISRINRAP